MTAAQKEKAFENREIRGITPRLLYAGVFNLVIILTAIGGAYMGIIDKIEEVKRVQVLKDAEQDSRLIVVEKDNDRHETSINNMLTMITVPRDNTKITIH